VEDGRGRAECELAGGCDCGFDRAEATTPVPYPVACSPQAWAAGAPFLFRQRPLPLDGKAASLLDDESRARLAKIHERFAAETDWTSEALEANLKAYAEELGAGLGKLAQPLRAALTGQATSPGIFDVLVLLGREESLARIADQAGG